MGLAPEFGDGFGLSLGQYFFLLVFFPFPFRSMPSTLVRVWVVSEARWNPEDAQAVYEIASNIKSGKKCELRIGEIFGVAIY